ncbi:MAG: non-homologous end-joining DNA ligase, partial [Caulobacteraceae bacterium]|nr:non-homologous end-joining DNA ligase [Caulobacter sp.]
GFRDDKPADEVEAERPSPTATPPSPVVAASTVRVAAVRPRGSEPVMGVTISHADKALWPDAGDGAPVTKLELARYYEAVGPWMLTHLAGRPCSMLRMPDGIGGDQKFFQRHAAPGQSALIDTVTLPGDPKPYLRFDRVEALIAAAQAGALELHPGNCALFAPEEPGRLVFDLDPAPDVPFTQVVAAALEIRDRLERLGLVGFPKTTGGKGLHVTVPVAADGIDWAAAKGFARAFCQAMADDAPARYLTSIAKKDRGGRIFLDYLRNDRTATAVAPLSPRGRPGASVSMPLRWPEVTKRLDPTRYTLRTVPKLIGRSSAWEGYDDATRSLSAAVGRLKAR